MTAAEIEEQWRQELESAGEKAIRDDVNYRRGITTGGEPKRQFVTRWLREKEQERQRREHQSDRYLRRTFWVAVATLVAAVIGVIATILHP